jgi:DNA-binding NtrC family response regulator
MASGKTSKPRQPTVAVDPAVGLQEVLALVPNAWAHHKDSATAIYNGLSLIRATMKHQFGIDPLVTKKPQHIDFALGLLTMMLEEARFSRRVVSRTERGAAKVARRDQKRRAELEKLLRTHKGNVSEVAREMNKGRTQIVRWIERYELDPDLYKGS